MANVFIEESILQGWADTVREKTGGTEKMLPSELLETTKNIKSGFSIEEIVNKTISGSYSSSEISEIQKYTFYNMSQLTGISFPNCSSIGEAAFSGCTNLSSVALNFESMSYVPSYAFADCNINGDVSLPSASTISDYAFYNNPSLTSLYAPSASIGQYTFANCINMSEITLSTDSDFVFDVGAFAFSGCTNLTSFVGMYSGSSNVPCIKNSLAVSGIFADCINLQSVCIYNGQFTQIGNYQFCGCTNLKTIGSDSTKCTTIGNYEVVNNSSIASDGRYAPVGIYAFSGCSNLSELRLSFATPPCTFREGAFKNCTKLSKLYINIDTASHVIRLASSVFENTPITDSSLLGYYGSIYVPSNLIATFRSRWASCSSRIYGYTF